MDQKLQLIRLDISNFMRIECLNIDVGGNHLVIHGRNNAGKSTALDALWYALTRRKLPQDPIRHGQKKGEVKVDIGRYIATRSFVPSGAKIVVEAKRIIDGEVVGEKVAPNIVEGLLADHALDPAGFVALSDSAQLAEALKADPGKPPVAEVEKIIGGKFPAGKGETPYDYLNRVAGEHGDLRRWRRDAGRDLKAAKAVADEASAVLLTVPLPVEGESLAEINKQIACLDGLQKIYGDKSQTVKNARDAAVVAISKGNDATELVEDLESKLVAARDARHAAAAVECTAKRAVSIAEKSLSGSTDQSEALATERAKILDATNRVVEEVKREAAVVADKSAREKLNDEQTRHTKWDNALSAALALRDEVAAGVKFDMPGLAVGDACLTYNGGLLSQEGDATQILAACDIQAKQNPDFRILRLDKAEQLDTAGRKRLFEYANAHDFQIVMAVVSDEDLRVEIVEKPAAAEPE